MKFIPNEDRILIKPDAAPEVSKGGILIPGTAKTQPTTGTVVAVGPGEWDKKRHEWTACAFLVGERVMFERRDTLEIEVDGEKLLVMEASDVLGSLRDS